MTGPRHAIISGGSSGIGYALAELLAARGWNISLLARNQERLSLAQEGLARQHPDGGARVADFSVDVSDQAGLERAVGAAMAEFGAPKLVIASAGIAHPGYFEEIPPETFHRLMEINYFGSLNLIRATLPAMRAGGGGRMVLISSAVGLIGIYGYSAYAPTKFALRGLAESLRAELGQDNIAISIVYPPDTDTPQLAAEAELKPPETASISAKAKVLSASAVAESILKGIDKGRFQIMPGWEMALLGPLHSLIGPLLRRYFDFLVSRTAGGRAKSPKP